MASTIDEHATEPLLDWARERTRDAEKVIADNHRLIWSIVNGLNPPPGVSKEDLYQAGVLQLLKSLHLFDPARGVKLSTWVYAVVRNACLQELISMSWRGEKALIEGRCVEAVEDAPFEAIADIEEDVGAKVSFDALTPEENFAVRAREAGYRPWEIARLMGMNREGGQTAVVALLDAAVIKLAA